MMSYKYNLYFYNIDSDQEIYTLNKGHINAPCAHYLNLHCQKDSVSSVRQTDVISPSDFLIQFPEIVKFRYINNESTMICSFESTEYLNEFITNAPFAVLVANDSGVLLHGSTIIIDNKAYVFLAPCGTGKSTLLLSLLKEKNTWYYSDDAVALIEEAGNLMLYKGSTKMKLKKDVLCSCGIDTQSLQQTSQLRDKFYVEYRERVFSEEKCKLEKVFILNRVESDSQLCISKLDGFKAMPFLLKGAVGYQNIFQNDMIRLKIIKNLRNFCPKMNVYELTFPTRLSVFDKNFIDAIINC